VFWGENVCRGGGGG